MNETFKGKINSLKIQQSSYQMVSVKIAPSRAVDDGARENELWRKDPIGCDWFFIWMVISKGIYQIFIYNITTLRFHTGYLDLNNRASQNAIGAPVILASALFSVFLLAVVFLCIIYKTRIKNVWKQKVKQVATFCLLARYS